MIAFHLNRHSGVPAYLQLVQQVRHAVRVGMLRPGDQLPTVKEVVSSLTINPNTVLHAYRHLDMEGVVDGRRGVGTFVAANPELEPPDDLEALRSSLERWIGSARESGLDDEAMAGLFGEAVRAASHSSSRVA
jgi:GntR family transcriptional regulator